MKSAILLILIMILAITGWGINLYKLTQCDFVAPYKCEAIRTIGIVPPLGAILGWIPIEDGKQTK